MMRRQESLAVRERKSSGIGVGVWSIVGGALLVAAAAAVIVSLPDIQRYMKIRSM